MGYLLKIVLYNTKKKFKMAARKRKATKKRVTKRRKKVAKRKVRAVTARRHAFQGKVAKTVGGLKKSDLKMNENGRVVSKKMSARASKGPLAKWRKCMMRARKELGLTGFVACKKGSKYYKLTRK